METTFGHGWTRRTARRAAGVTAVVILLAVTASARADVIVGTSTTSVHLPVWVGGLSASPGYRAGIGSDPSFLPWGDLYFFSFTGDATANASGPEFLDAAALLTNGNDNALGLLFGGAWYGMQSESAAFSGPGFSDPDFAGQVITRMVLSQNSWSSQMGGTDIVFTVSYYAVPEPATLSLLAVGGLAVLRRRKN